jgi:ATP-dependent DNA helicase RecG
MDLQARIPDVSRTYKIYAGRLEKLGITKVEDFLYHFPFRYEDYSLISKVTDLQPGEIATVQGQIVSIKNDYARRFRTIQRAKIKDETGELEIIWFNQPYIPKSLNTGDFISVSGKVELNKGKLGMVSPDYEQILNGQTIHTGRLVPVYPETRGVTSKWLRRQIYRILNENKQNLDEYLPYSMLEKLSLTGFSNSIEQIHFPIDISLSKRARERLSFDEMLLLHLSSLTKKSDWENVTSFEPVNYIKFKKEVETFISNLPYRLTDAQSRALREIIADLVSGKPMNRLLQGEVGSGKTVVATIAMYLCHLNEYSAILMAPTEILANQHYNTISSLVSPYGLRVELVTGSKKSKKEDFDILIGTHAVLFKNLDQKNVKLVVVDEQQRFGVAQRALIRQKGKGINSLTMTATPIPRTVALTMYGNLSLSYLDEMPIGRKTVKTWLVPPQKRDGAYKWIEKKVKEGDQAFIICPFIEESESAVTVKAATTEFARLQKEVFPNLKLGILHGKLKSKEKQEVLENFKNKKIDILVATPVVEVGIDFPNATIILIEASERFGLAQLHQLRGRVGRGDKQSYCLLFTEVGSPNVQKRLKALETLHNGAELAGLDLKLRGPGTLYGTMQHGVPRLKIASFSDFDLIQKTRKVAEDLFPKLNKYPKLLEKVKNLNLEQVSPD